MCERVEPIAQGRQQHASTYVNRRAPFCSLMAALRLRRRRRIMMIQICSSISRDSFSLYSLRALRPLNIFWMSTAFAASRRCITWSSSSSLPWRRNTLVLPIWKAATPELSAVPSACVMSSSHRPRGSVSSCARASLMEPRYLW